MAGWIRRGPGAGGHAGLTWLWHLSRLASKGQAEAVSWPGSSLCSKLLHAASGRGQRAGGRGDGAEGGGLGGPCPPVRGAGLEGARRRRPYLGSEAGHRGGAGARGRDRLCSAPSTDCARRPPPARPYKHCEHVLYGKRPGRGPGACSQPACSSGPGAPLRRARLLPAPGSAGQLGHGGLACTACGRGCRDHSIGRTPSPHPPLQ